MAAVLLLFHWPWPIVSLGYGPLCWRQKGVIYAPNWIEFVRSPDLLPATQHIDTAKRESN